MWPADMVESARRTMRVELKKDYRFEAAHFLPCVPAGHKCARMHGHSYRVELAVTGEVDPRTGWLIDFQVIDDAWVDLYRRLDHRTLNEVPGLDNSTCENLAAYIWAAVRPTVPQLSAVTVWETVDACCVYRGE
jgi:6-pyruvoyltetrahydropterin/6-carboxytetrahydropterin synthase